LSRVHSRASFNMRYTFIQSGILRLNGSSCRPQHGWVLMMKN
jgi:hypothetical protein